MTRTAHRPLPRLNRQPSLRHRSMARSAAFARATGTPLGRRAGTGRLGGSWLAPGRGPTRPPSGGRGLSTLWCRREPPHRRRFGSDGVSVARTDAQAAPDASRSPCAPRWPWGRPLLLRFRPRPPSRGAQRRRRRRRRGPPRAPSLAPQSSEKSEANHTHVFARPPGSHGATADAPRRRMAVLPAEHPTTRVRCQRRGGFGRSTPPAPWPGLAVAPFGVHADTGDLWHSSHGRGSSRHGQNTGHGAGTVAWRRVAQRRRRQQTGDTLTAAQRPRR